MKTEHAKFQEFLIKQIGSELALLALLEMIIEDQLPENDFDFVWSGEIRGNVCPLGGMFNWAGTQQGHGFWSALDAETQKKNRKR